MKSISDTPLRIERVAVGRPAALALVFAHLTTDTRQRRIEQVLADAAAGQDYALWVGVRDDVVAAGLTHFQAGRAAMVWPPQVATGEPLDTARQLLARTLDELMGRDVQMAQALLEIDRGEAAALLIESGFSQIARLLCMVSLHAGFPVSRPDDQLEFIEYSPAEHARLAKIAARTYLGSLDCPQVDRLREIDDVLAGYRAAGGFDPARWLIVRHQSADIGCLLLTGQTPIQWELTYMGLVPEARGGGFGLAMVRHAQWLAGQCGCERIVLAVDAANAPAIDAYEDAGFITWDQRSVFLRQI